MIGFNSLSEWLEEAEKIGELVRVEGAALDYEPAIISQLNAHNRGPALLFQNIKGHRNDLRLALNLLSNTRTIALTFGLPLEITLRETVDTLRAKFLEWAREQEKYPPQVVKVGPVLDNVKKGDSIDLTAFPVPRWHETDGGRYIGTGDAIITRAPDSPHINVGTYRSQLLSKKEVSIHAVHGHHGRLHLDQWRKTGKKMPVVMVFGPDPLLFAISSTDFPESVAELNYIGAVRGRPVPVLIGEHTGLPIPAFAEIALEGFVDTTRLVDEGPFGEWPGYSAGGQVKEPAVEVVALYHKDHPIIVGSPPGKGSYCDFGLLQSICRSAVLFNEMVSAGVRGVKGVWLPECGGSRFLQVVAIEQLYDGHAAQAGLVAAGTYTGALAGRYTIIVDDDIDPYDLEDVMWAVCTRSHPTDADIIKRAWTTGSDPMVRKPATAINTSRAIIYAVKPFDWRDSFPPVILYSEGKRRETFQRWQHLFGKRWQGI